MPVKVKWEYTIEQAGLCYGLSEHVYFLSSDDVEAAKEPAKKLIAKRLAWCAVNVQTLGIRLSSAGPPKTTDWIPSIKLAGNGQGAVFGEQSTLASDTPNNCVLLRATNLNQRGRNMYCAGIPDTVLKTAPVGPSFVAAGAGFSKAFEAWKKELCGGVWGFMARAIAEPNAEIIDWITEAAGTGRIGAVVGTDIANATDKVQVSGITGFPLGGAVPLGTWRVASEVQDEYASGTWTYYLRNTEGYSPAAINNPGKLIKVQYQPFAFTGVEVTRQGHKKRGTGGARARGRSSRRRS